MKKDTYNEIQKLIFNCFQEITDHTLQSDVISPHIKEINNNLKQMIGLLEKTKTRDFDIPTLYPQGRRERNIIMDIDKEKLIKVAYAMSRFDYHIINDIIKNNYNQTDAFEFLSHKLKIKSNTLKNYRDSFDPYIKQENSNRRGWYQKELTPEFRAIKEIWDGESYNFIKDEIKNILT
jgi:hypothetical protein